jgi:hypothetical protein
VAVRKRVGVVLVRIGTEEVGGELVGIVGIVAEQRGLRREQRPGKFGVACVIDTCREADVVLRALGPAQQERVVPIRYLEAGLGAVAVRQGCGARSPFDVMTG